MPRLHDILLTTTQRDLHWLLCSEPLLATECLPMGIRQGDATLGQSWWQQLAPGIPDIEAHPQRLGRYAEALLQTALQQLPGHRLWAHQLLVRDADQHSIGEFDFLLQAPAITEVPQANLAPTLLHIELAVKIYIALEDGSMVGPGLRDALDLKLAKLFGQQLRLAAHPAARALLPPNLAVHPLLWLRGRIFYREPKGAHDPRLSLNHPRGWWRRIGEDIPQTRTDSRWRCLERLEWMAPRVADSRAQTLADCLQAAEQALLRRPQALMLAEFAPLAEGGAELARGLLLSADWPDPEALARLRQVIQSR